MQSRTWTNHIKKEYWSVLIGYVIKLPNLDKDEPSNTLTLLHKSEYLKKICTTVSSGFIWTFEGKSNSWLLI